MPTEAVEWAKDCAHILCSDTASSFGFQSLKPACPNEGTKNEIV